MKPQVILIKRLKKAKRRPFTKPEIRKLLKVADFEWRGIILCGLYTGLRISDIALLTWENLDLVKCGVDSGIPENRKEDGHPHCSTLETVL